jgi:hypothetical protein
MGDNKAKVNGYINDQNLVERVETWIDNPFLGDMLFEAIYSDYKSAGGAQFPTHIVQKQGGYPTFDLRLTDVQANAAVNIQPAQGRGGRRWWSAALRRHPGAEKLGDGIYLIKGGYAAFAVDFKDGITIVEAGQSEARGPRGHRRSEEADSQQAGQIRRQHAQPHRPFERLARGGGRRRDDSHVSVEQGVSREDAEPAAHVEPGQGAAGREEADRRGGR